MKEFGEEERGSAGNFGKNMDVSEESEDNKQKLHLRNIEEFGRYPGADTFLYAFKDLK